MRCANRGYVLSQRLHRDVDFSAQNPTAITEASMARKPKTWAEKMLAPPAHVERLEKNFGGMPAGALMLISTPQEVAAFVKDRVPRGETITIPELRVALAQAHGAVGTCPLTTSIFLRIAAEAAWDEMQAGASADDVTPFWRAVDPKSDLAKKLRCGPDWLAWQRATERT